MEVKEFDRDPDLHELLTPLIRRHWLQALPLLLGDGWQIQDKRNTVLLPEPPPPAAEAPRYPLSIELEPIGYLITSAPLDIARNVAKLLVSVLTERWRYQMSADLHLEISVADFAELQQRHTLLQASEARYRELAEHLESRVIEQVSVIEKQQMTLYQAEKLAAVGQLAAGMAHEINNPIGFIKSNLRSANQYFDTLKNLLAGMRKRIDLEKIWTSNDLDFIFSDGEDLMRECIDGVERIARIVTALKEFSAVDSLGAKTIDINQQIRNVCELARTQVKSQGEIELLLNNVQPVCCQAGAVNQALLHLVTNALLATEQGGHVKISTRQQNSGIAIQVEDNGPGIPENIQARIFEPFFTTRPVGKGQGLGLKVCHDVALAHGGSIECLSTPGHGAAFTLFLSDSQLSNPLLSEKGA